MLVTADYELFYVRMDSFNHMPYSQICISYRTCEIDNCSLFMLFHGDVTIAGKELQKPFEQGRIYRVTPAATRRVGFPVSSEGLPN
jgi:hypothetical protein